MFVRSLVVVFLLAPSLLFAQEPLREGPFTPPANELLVKHRNWFVPPHVWDIQKNPSLSKYRPQGLTYSAYSAGTRSPTRSPSSAPLRRRRS